MPKIQILKIFTLFLLVVGFVGLIFPPAVYSGSPCNQGFHRVNDHCVKTDENHPINNRSDLNCKSDQTPKQIQGGPNDNKWYCKDNPQQGGGQAQGQGGAGGAGGQPGHCDSNNCDLIALYVNPFIRLLSIIVGLVVAASLIMGGIQYSASSGDPQKTSAAKSRIQNTLLALFAFLFLYAFLNFLVPGGIF